MKNQTGIVLIVLCVGLAAALIWSQHQFNAQKTADALKIGNYSNNLVETSAILQQQREVNTSLEGDLRQQHESFARLTNSFTEVTAGLEKTGAALVDARKEITQRDARIADLQSQNELLDHRASDLGTAITNLTSQITDTRKKLAASEGDKAFLEKELQRLMGEKAELEKQFSDLAVLRAQVAKLKEEMSVSRRLEWIRDGIFDRQEQKGGAQLTQKTTFTNRQPKPTYDLNVEVSSDGTVTIIPANTNIVVLTNNPAATNLLK
jgi:chromosome segregation ATPase